MDDGEDMNLLVHEGKKAEDAFLQNGTLPDPTSTDNAEVKIVLPVIQRLLQAGVMDEWNQIAARCKGVSEETISGVHRLCTMEKKNSPQRQQHGAGRRHGPAR